MIYRFFMGCENKIASLSFDSDNGALSVAHRLPFDGKVTAMTRQGNMLYIVSENESGTAVRSVSAVWDKLNETSVVFLDRHGTCGIEFADSVPCIITSNGPSGDHTIFPIDGRGRIADRPVTVMFSGDESDPFAACSRMTTNPHRIACAEKSDGTVAVSNLFGFNGIQVRECSRVTLGGDKGVKDIIFTNADMAFILAEGSLEIIAADFHSGSGSLWPLASYFPFPSDAAGSSLSFAAGGGYLFAVSSAGYVAAYEIKSGDSLALKARIRTEGISPDSIAVTQDGKYALVSSAEEDLCAVYELVSGTNELRLVALLQESRPFCALA